MTKAMIDGYVKVWRRYFYSADWLAPRKFSRQEAYIDLISQASFADRVVQLGEGRSVALYKGEVLASQGQLAKRWGWSKSAVFRYLHKLAEGDTPLIECYTRKVVAILSKTPSETPSETSVTIVKPSDCVCCMPRGGKPETQYETPIETPSGTYNNKEYIRENNNTHTEYSYLVKFFERARCMRTREDAPALAQVATEANEWIRATAAGRAMYDKLSRCERGYLWLWANHRALLLCFAKPCTPADFGKLDESYEVEDVKRVVEAMANKIPQSGGMLGSFSTTFRQWAALDHRIKQKAELGNPRYAWMMN